MTTLTTPGQIPGEGIPNRGGNDDANNDDEGHKVSVLVFPIFCCEPLSSFSLTCTSLLPIIYTRKTIPLWILHINHFLLSINCFLLTLIAKVLALATETNHFFARLCKKCIVLLSSSYVKFCIYLRSAMMVVYNMIKNHYPLMMMMMMMMQIVLLTAQLNLMQSMIEQLPGETANIIIPLVTTAQELVNATHILGQQWVDRDDLMVTTAQELDDATHILGQQWVHRNDYMVGGWNVGCVGVIAFSFRHLVDIIKMIK
jgi:hypothetical protein